MASFLVAVISPIGVLVEDRVAHNIAILEENGFLRLEQETMELTPYQASLVGDQGAGSVQDFVSGPCVVLLLKAKNAYATFDSLRNELDFTYGSSNTWLAVRDRSLFFPKQPALERAFIIIKPEYTQQDYATILEVLDSNDFVVVGKVAKILSTENATQIFGTDNKDEIDYLTSDVSVSLVVEGLNALTNIQLLAGPADPVVAKKYAPQSIRARLGHDLIRNSLYASESWEQTVNDIKILFPTPFPIQRTLAIIKPDAISHVDQILSLVRLHEFTILASDTLSLSKSRAEQIYSAQRSSPQFEALTRHMSSGECKVYVLGKAGAIEAWRKICGPTDPQVARREKPQTLRARLGRDLIQNAVHASADAASASKEIDEFFPQLAVDNIPGLTELQDILTSKAAPRAHVESSVSLHDVLVDGLTSLCRVKPTGNDAILWLADWLDRNNPNKPLIQHVEQTEKQNQKVSVELSQRSHGRPINVIWIVGPPFSGKTTIGGKLAKSLGYEHISLTEILNICRNSDPNYGDIINQYLTHHKSLPTHIVNFLLERAMRSVAGKVSGFVISNFPSSLDQAFHFEEKICKLKLLISLEINSMDATKRAIAANRDNDSDIKKQEIYKRFKQYEDEIMPVIEHYKVFRKVTTVNATAPIDQVFTQVIAAVPNQTK